MNNFGILLRRARVRKGVSQAHIAKRIGLVQQTISAIEAGKRACPPDVVQTLSSYLDAPELEYAYCGSCPVRCGYERGIA